MKLLPLGEEAVLAALPSTGEAVRLAEHLRSGAPNWLQDIVPAYAQVGIYFDRNKITLQHVEDWITQQLATIPQSQTLATGTLHIIPVCYEMQQDIQGVCEYTQLGIDEVIQLHSGSIYTVYAIGFVPGFPYLGELPQALSGVPRLTSPRVRVEPGSVGITGKQTGIYPLARPGGWNLIGRTPLTIVDVEAEYFPIRVGDRVQFTRIDEREFQVLFGKRL